MASTGSGGEVPRSGYYPDPSIPGYIRYWDGLSWVPGTSRPEPVEGEPFPEPPRRATGGARPPASPTVGGTGEVRAPGGSPATPEIPEQPERGQPEQGQFDEPSGVSGTVPGPSADALPQPRTGGEVLPQESVTDWDDPRRIHGNRPQSAGGWQSATPSDAGGSAADAATNAALADPRGGSWGRTDGNAPARRGDPSNATAHGGTTDLSWQPNLAPDSHGQQGPQGQQEAPGQPGLPPGSPETMGFRLPQATSSETSSTEHLGDGGGHPLPASSAEAAGTPSPDVNQTMGFRTPQNDPRFASTGESVEAAWPEHTVGLRRSEVLDSGTQQLRSPGADSGTQQLRGPAAPPATAGTPRQDGGAAEQPDEARPPWERQVRSLPGQRDDGSEAVTPWRPPVSDPFLQAAQQQERPAGLGRRFAARLVDAVVVFGVTGAVAFPFAGKAMDHVQEQIDAAELAGETRQIWLVDGTTGGYLALVIGVFLLVGLLYEALPTARWGRTLGKRLFGVRVLDIERQDVAGTAAAVVRWLTFSVLALLVIGVVNVLWCLFDRPWRQCWHDKLARTFVAGD